MRAKRLSQLLRIAARNFLRYKLQAVLITLGTMTGTAGVIVSAGYAAGGRQKIVDQLSSLGTNVIVVSPAPSKSVGGRARTGAAVTTLKAGDYEALRLRVQSVVSASAMVSTVMRIRAGDLTKNTSLVGCEPGFFQIKHWRTSQGSTFADSQNKQQARVAVLGANVSRDLFGEGDPTGEHIAINRIPFVVSGVLMERGQSLDAANEDDQVYVPLQTAMRRLLNVDFYNSILFEVDNWSHMDDAGRDMNDLLGKRHRIVASGESDFQIRSQKSLIDTQLASFTRLTFLVKWISASGLIVSSLGVFALTWIGVKNRTREIGTRRAIGANRTDILTQFLAESTMASLLGCTLGLVASYMVLRLICARLHQPFVFSAEEAIAEAAASVVLYSAFTLLSSLRAIRIEPLVALRSE